MCRWVRSHRCVLERMLLGVDESETVGMLHQAAQRTPSWAAGHTEEEIGGRWAHRPIHRGTAATAAPHRARLVRRGRPMIMPHVFAAEALFNASVVVIEPAVVEPGRAPINAPRILLVERGYNAPDYRPAAVLSEQQALLRRQAQQSGRVCWVTRVGSAWALLLEAAAGEPVRDPRVAPP